jgi:uncharacterized RDD family membrane protein YckC
MSWYYAEDGKQLGPISEADFNASVSAGRITDETLVWQEGMPQWTRYGEVKSAGGAAVITASATACVECERLFPEDAMANFGGRHVCEQCKPTYVQKLKEGVRIGGDLPYAGRRRRTFAKLIDIIIQLVFTYGPLLFLAGSALASESTHMASSFGLTFLFLGLNIYFLGKFGATPGKLLLKARVVRADGSRISYARATGRVFAEMLSGLTFYIGYLMAFWDAERRTLHDRIADTRVIYLSK